MTAPTNSNPLLPGGARVFKTRSAPWFPYVFGGCFGMFGLLAVFIGIVGVVAGGGGKAALPLLFGLLFIVIGVGIPVGMYFFARLYTITCRPEGFTVRSDNKRKGSEQHDYKWEEVTSTNYYESLSQNRRNSRTDVSFIVETARGRAFSVGRTIGDFAGLIKVFNAMTPHLPYTWEPRTGFSMTIGGISAGRSAYVSVPRPAAPDPNLPNPPAASV